MWSPMIFSIRRLKTQSGTQKSAVLKETRKLISWICPLWKTVSMISFIRKTALSIWKWYKIRLQTATGEWMHLSIFRYLWCPLFLYGIRIYRADVRKNPYFEDSFPGRENEPARIKISDSFVFLYEIADKACGKICRINCAETIMVNRAKELMQDISVMDYLKIT